jgi:hypothetical protein
MISLKGNHITITKGDTGSISFQFNQKCKPFNLNGWTVNFIVKQKGSPDSTAIISLSSSVTEDITRVVIALDSTNTTHEAKDYDCAVRLTKTGSTLTVFEGIFSIVQGVFA